MKRTLVIVIILLACFHPDGAKAQAIRPNDIPQEWLMRVDLFDDFISRFNWEEAGQIRLNRWITHPLKTLSKRELAILSLCDNGSVLQNRALNEFVRYVTTNNLKLDILKNCKSVVIFSYKDKAGKDVDITLTFRLVDNINAPKWIITNAQSPYFNYGDRNKRGTISYADNELEFMCMKTLAGGNPQQLAGDDFEYNGLPVFLFLTANNFLTYSYVKEQSYVLKIGDYQATVKHCEPKDHNRKGLLITNLLYQGKVIFINKRDNP